MVANFGNVDCRMVCWIKIECCLFISKHFCPQNKSDGFEKVKRTEKPLQNKGTAILLKMACWGKKDDFAFTLISRSFFRYPKRVEFLKFNIRNFKILPKFVSLWIYNIMLRVRWKFFQTKQLVILELIKRNNPTILYHLW